MYYINNVLIIPIFERLTYHSANNVSAFITMYMSIF